MLDINAHLRRTAAAFVVAALFSTAATPVAAQEAASPELQPQPKSMPLTIDALGWLAGCWRGSVNQREFREHWLPLRGGMMVGAGHTVLQDKTQDFEYMRIEARPDGVYYVVIPSGKPEAAFKLTTIRSDEQVSEFAFVRDGNAFPDRMIYVRGQEGWLYATVQGSLSGAERKVTYPMRRISCETGELILN